MSVTRAQLIGNVSGGASFTGIVTATGFSGNGSGLIGVGLGTTGSINTSGIITSTSIVVSAGTTALPSISPTGDSNTGIFFPAADTVAISEGGVEALRVDSSGRLLVGISTSGNANGGVLQLKSGITFPATAVAATDVNTLDDYEEGTFTPTIIQGITSITYTTQLGTYSKVGRLVYFNIRIVTTAGTTDGNQTVLFGLPFTPAATSFAATFYGPSAVTTGIGQVQTNSRINLYQNASTINTANINGNNFTSGVVNIFVTGCYEI